MMEFKKGDKVKLKGGPLKGKVWAIVGDDLYDVKIKHLPEVNTYNSNDLKLRKSKKEKCQFPTKIPSTPYDSLAIGNFIKMLDQLLKTGEYKSSFPAGGYVPKNGFEKAFEKKVQADYDQLKKAFEHLLECHMEELANDPTHNVALRGTLKKNWRTQAGLDK